MLYVAYIPPLSHFILASSQLGFESWSGVTFGDIYKHWYETVLIIIPPMTPSPPAGDAQPSPNQETPPPSSVPSHPPRPLQREGARYFLTPGEQALADDMLRSSPPPESALGKRVRQGDDPPGDNDTEPDEGPSPTGQRHSGTPTISNVSVACQRYAMKKRLRPEQYGELDEFLSVSDISLAYFDHSYLQHRSGLGAWSAGQVICGLVVPGEQNRFPTISCTSLYVIGRFKSTYSNLIQALTC